MPTQPSSMLFSALSDLLRAVVILDDALLTLDKDLPSVLLKAFAQQYTSALLSKASEEGATMTQPLADQVRWDLALLQEMAGQALESRLEDVLEPVRY